jgi:predicted TIM-barrel fold metal-dependent hydrolase
VPYAEGRIFRDADSHVMELPDFLTRHADRDLTAVLAPISTASAGGQGAGIDDYAVSRRHSAAQVAVLEQNVIGGAKGYEALGAFDPAERSRALDLLGFHSQLIFGTFAAEPFLHHERIDVRYRGSRVFNRAIAEFCADDPRMLPVGVVSLADPRAAADEIELAIADGCAAIWVPAEPCGGRSPGHDDLDRVWSILAEAHVPVVLHVGGQPIPIPAGYGPTGRSVGAGFAGGGEAMGLKDFPLLHQSSEEFVSVLVLDGVLERHLGLRGAVVELGATWVPGLLRRLDHAVDNMGRFYPEVQSFTRRPSEQLREQFGFTPFPFEDVGALIDASSDDLYLFSSDYPHVEGGRNPLGRFETSLRAASEVTKRRFYSENFERVMSWSGTEEGHSNGAHGRHADLSGGPPLPA